MMSGQRAPLPWVSAARHILTVQQLDSVLRVSFTSPSSSSGPFNA